MPRQKVQAGAQFDKPHRAGMSVQPIANRCQEGRLRGADLWPAAGAERRHETAEGETTCRADRM